MTCLRPLFLGLFCLLALVLLAAPETAWASPGHHHGSDSAPVAEAGASDHGGASRSLSLPGDHDCPTHKDAGDCPEAFHCSPQSFSLRGSAVLEPRVSAQRAPWRIDAFRRLRALAPAIDLPPPRLG